MVGLVIFMWGQVLTCAASLQIDCKFANHILDSSVGISFVFFAAQTLYKTQVRELKEECEEKTKLCKELQQKKQEFQDER